MEKQQALEFHNGAALLAALQAEALERAQRALAGVLAYHEAQRLTGELQAEADACAQRAAALEGERDSLLETFERAVQATREAQAARILVPDYGPPAEVSAAMNAEREARRAEGVARTNYKRAVSDAVDAQQAADKAAQLAAALGTVPEPDHAVLAILAEVL
jgi:hypothetical protein